MDSKHILLLIDYRDKFYSTTKSKGAGFDLQKLKESFESYEYKLDIRNFSEIDFRKEDFKGVSVLYQSSEDPNLYYKDYIEDVLLGLCMQGARLIPDFNFFRAHHNKVFMEFIRDIRGLGLFDSIESKSYGTLEDFIKSSPNIKDTNKQYILKDPGTSGSRGVYKVMMNKRGLRLLRNVSHSPSLKNLEYAIKSLLERKKYIKISNNRKKFTIQSYIDNIKGDYRVIIYGNKYYVLYRENRDNDFRASGSKKFHSSPKVSPALLDFSEKVFNVLDVPYLALDIGIDESDESFHLFEFQAISFGQGCVEWSAGHYYKDQNTSNWCYKEEQPNIEKNLVASVIRYLDNKGY